MPMMSEPHHIPDRTASYTIKGFLYQFQKTLLEVLNADDQSIITVEGIIEDIDIATHDGTTAIQCKYHESASRFTLSSIYKPLLLMMVHYHTYHTSSIRYNLFLHFSGDTSSSKAIDRNAITEIFSSKDKALEKLIDQVKDHLDIDGFISVFSLQFGPSFEEQKMQVISALENAGINRNDAEYLAYPNAIHLIASMSTLRNPNDRIINKRWLIDSLKETKAVLLTRWTRELTTKRSLLKALRNQLKNNLGYNDRARCFFMNSEGYSDFETAVVRFIKDFKSKYHCKPSHLQTPIFCIHTELEAFHSVQKRLREGGIKMADGYSGTYFNITDLFRDPIVQGRGTNRKVEFDIRIVHWGSNGQALKEITPEDVYIIGQDCFDLRYSDVDINHLECVTFKELSYLMGVSNEYE
jgi:hypothetical protein